jgi:hypothetical protein
MATNSNSVSAGRKPRADFPLCPHATGRRAKKVHGKLHYFGKTAGDPKGEAAESLWNEQKDNLYAGRTPRGKRERLTVDDLCNRFLAFNAEANGDAESFTFPPTVIAAFRIADDGATDSPTIPVTKELVRHARGGASQQRVPKEPLGMS